MTRMMTLYTEGWIKPISPVTEWPATKVEDAMRSMQKGKHRGKNVITFSPQHEDLPATPRPRIAPIRSDASYLLVGGMGGLGRSLASWLVEAGAKYLIFFSRSAGKVGADDPFVRELTAQGCSVHTVSGDVGKREDVEQAVAQAPTRIAGVFQASMVLTVGSIRSFHSSETDD